MVNTQFSSIVTQNFGQLPENEMRISDLFISISRALDMGKIEILDHSSRVAYISLELANYLEFNKKEINKLVLTSLINNIGIMSVEEKRIIKNNFQLNEKFIERQSRNGANLLKKINFLPNIDNIILYSHHKWNGDNFDNVKEKKIPLASRIIFLADRIESLISEEKYILFQVDRILNKIKEKSGEWFDPDLVKAFLKLAKKESFWLNLETKEYNNILEEWGKETQIKINLKNLESLATILAHLIDRISPFTSRHSTGVSTIAAMLTHELGYEELEQRVIRIAGLFHDLGKLIIPAEIIEKEAELTDKEYKIIKQHSYYTYRLLKKIRGLGSMPEWAAFHHERLDGSGYPFRFSSEDINIGSRIMAVSDVFQALTEDRPYRSAFTISKALEIMEEMVENNKIDENIFLTLKQSI
ncbi:MAG TPA: HD domain-containing phosphohydrolase [Halanaerobiales bacterium]|nr:HD domain-containing phosphohydrolase [Halanaerobiales bacterium]